MGNQDLSRRKEGMAVESRWICDERSGQCFCQLPGSFIF